MNTELEQKIIKAAPELFRLAKIQTKWDGPKYPIMFGFEHGDGWYHILYDLCLCIRNYCKWNNVPFPQITQIKEKFGTLRFYYNGGNDKIDGMVWLAEHMTASMCEYCGTHENVGVTQGWISYICKDCLEKTNKDLIWKPLNQ